MSESAEAWKNVNVRASTHARLVKACKPTRKVGEVADAAIRKYLDEEEVAEMKTEKEG